ncbi:ScbA/BarX family gamma-butyrolactone biosynthesis protein [Streptomyces xiaopingdaonensis]|uniref:ScbA/BarX family gamma-butyrolactone biosynthesis protein n=1 Tax=Streptomyces xiaopingdaonensis TaxID=1565415 RepID=UPI00031EE4CA|nr:ScbA/BarX family gamma-butyrolactone biosynthesis protein [Streptomyces xiaopingdaonensis]
MLDEPELFEQSVPRRLVHRDAVSEVLLTGFRRSSGIFRVGVQWPRGHSYYGAVAGRWHDPMLFAEGIRQVGLFLAHQELDVPLGSHFVTDNTWFTMTEKGARLADGPANIVLEVAFSEVVRRRGSVTAYAYDVTAYRDGERIGAGHLSAQVIADRIYRRLRGDRLGARPPAGVPSAVSPRLVGRSTGFDVVLAPGTPTVLRVDASHPVLFDHPVDHVPGMVLLEAARQKALAELGRPEGLLTDCAAAFTRYVEFNSPCLVKSSPPRRKAAGQYELAVDFEQEGAVVGSCRVGIEEGDRP